MESLLWRSFIQTRTIKSSQDQDTKSAASILQALLVRLVCGPLNLLGDEDDIYSDLGGFLGQGATFWVEKKKKKKKKENGAGNSFVAVKHIIQDIYPNSCSGSRLVASKVTWENVLLEVRALSHYDIRKHQNIVKLIGYGLDDNSLPFLIVEYAELGSLDTFLHLHTTSWAEKRNLTLDIASGLELLHACQVVHGDVKLENILVFADEKVKFVAKLSDFGFCHTEGIGSKVYHGTDVLNAPEVRLDSDHTASAAYLDYMSCDAYSFGLAAWEIFNEGERYYTIPSIVISASDRDQAESFLQQLNRNGEELFTYGMAFLEGLNMPEELKDIVVPILPMAMSRDPEERSKMEDIRMRLDPRNEREIEAAQPLGKSYYSIFDIFNIALPWELKTELFGQFDTGAHDKDNPSKGHDAFNLAACHALGFGTLLDLEKAFSCLKLAADCSYTPGRLLCNAFTFNGLSQVGSPVQTSDEFGQYLITLETDIAKYPFTQQFSARLRRYYQDQNHRLSSSPMVVSRIGEFKSVNTMEDVLLSNISILHELTVDLNVNEVLYTLPLLHHLITSHPDTAEILIRKGVNVEALTDRHVSLLNIACSVGSIQIVRILLEFCPELAQQPSIDGVSPIHWLFMFDDSEIPSIAKLLVDNGAGFLAHGIVELVDFNLVLSGLPLHWAIMARNTSAVSALIKLGANPNEFYFQMHDYMMYPVHAIDLAVCLHLPEIVQTLIDSGAVIDDRSEYSVSPALHHIGESNDPFRTFLLHGSFYKTAARETIETLLANGSAVDALSFDGITALQYFAGRSTWQLYVIEALLDLEPSVTTGGESFRCPIVFAAIALRHDRVNSAKMKLLVKYAATHLKSEEFEGACTEALSRCTQDGTLGAARAILEVMNSPANQVIEDLELVHLAAKYDQVEMINFLLRLGASPNLDTGRGTPSVYAAAMGKRRALGALLQQGASVKSMPTTDWQRTILHEIVSPMKSAVQSFKTMEFVHERFRDLFVPVVDNYDSSGYTALHLAIIWGNLKNTAMLLELFGASPSNVEHTDISPESLIAVLKQQPPCLYVEQGALVTEEYLSTLGEITDYLCGPHGLERSQITPKTQDLDIFWTRPEPHLWEENDAT